MRERCVVKSSPDCEGVSMPSRLPRLSRTCPRERERERESWSWRWEGPMFAWREIRESWRWEGPVCACRRVSCAGAVATIVIAYGLLFFYFRVFPDARLAGFLEKLGTDHHVPTIDTAPAAHTNSPSRLTFSCKDFGLTEDKILEEGQLYHTMHSDANATCRSKYQHQCFRKNTPLIPPTFLSTLRAYELYHERCTKDANITALGIAGDAPEGCKYLVWTALEGMGNQLLSLVCAFIYSLLTNRTMLIGPTDIPIKSYLCNPFPLSSWLLPDDFPEESLHNNAKHVADYINEIQHGPKHSVSMPHHLRVLILCCDKGYDHQFFCPTSQKLFRGINWMFYASHEHILPAFYFIPEFRRKLNLWFPNHDAFMHASRYLLHPDDGIWDHITQFYKSHMDEAQKQIGLQVRVWGKEYEPVLNSQISRCVVDQMLLPKPQGGSNQSNAASATSVMDVNGQQARPDIVVLVVSLMAEYQERLAMQYANHDGTNGSTYVRVLTASTERSQRTGNAAHDEAAIVDIWLLSFMQEMVLTPYSTFGSVASGMAGVVPLLFINYGEDKVWEAACARSNVAGPCYLFYPRSLTCELDPPRFNIIDPASMVPEVRLCNFNTGLGIESTFYIP